MGFLLILILALVFILPFVFKKVEHNLEIFLFFMGILATIVSRTLSVHLIGHILSNYLLYVVTAVVLIMGFLFNLSVNKLKNAINLLLSKINLEIFIFLVLLILGLFSSVITAIVATLIMVEILHLLPLRHSSKSKVAIAGCYAIGFGAALTPIGEPLSTIVVSILKEDFAYLLRLVGHYIIPVILVMALLGSFIAKREKKFFYRKEEMSEEDRKYFEIEDQHIKEVETHKDVVIRAGKIFLFIVALELLGNGFKPFIDKYIVKLGDKLLFWLNTISAVLDNATVAAAIISPKLTSSQVTAILLSLLASGGMLIQGNIPNIIAANKLEIKSKEWVKFGFPIGLVLLTTFYVILFVI